MTTKDDVQAQITAKLEQADQLQTKVIALRMEASELRREYLASVLNPQSIKSPNAPD